ncbi:Aminopeptidase YwaD precursor [Phycisphaerae bacterium RAS1]|nr:Aminopeptidase YwaD precursor [Phycisphaerae bacterium RAS1]
MLRAPMSIVRRGLIVNVILSSCIAATALAGASLSERLDRASTLFSAPAYLEHMKYLAGEELAGRGTGTPGNALAAEYIARKFAEAGCKPAGADGGWYQPFDVKQRKELIDADAALNISGLPGEWKLHRDWRPFPFSAMDRVEGPLAFVGYGIEASEHEWNDYADFEVKDKVVLLFRFEPPVEDPEAEFGGKTPSRYALFLRKARTAAEHGAVGILVVNPPHPRPTTQPASAPAGDELSEYNLWSTGSTYKLPMIHISQKMADAILKQAGQPDLSTLQKTIDTQRKPMSRDLPGLSAKLNPGLRQVQARNVIGVLPGGGVTDEYVVIGAHYDHLGRQPRSFQSADATPVVHNGADDNASGTCGILELAKALGQGPKLRRNILFIAFSGEELGLLGSEHFVKHPTIPLERVKAMINFDMIGRLSIDKFTIYGIGTATEFEDMIRAAASECELKYRSPKGVPGNSDHAPFHREKIPVLFPFTGIHKQYHQPDDDVETIDADGAAKVLRFSYAIVSEVADLSDGPTWQDKKETVEPGEDTMKKPGIEEQEKDEKESDKDAVAKAHAQIAEKLKPKKDDTPDDTGRPVMPRVRLGITPDYAAEGKGLVVSTVADGGAAKEGGMQDGDTITHIAGKPISGIEDYMDVLRDFKPGDEIEIVVLRGEQKVTLKVKLKGAPERREPN